MDRILIKKTWIISNAVITKLTTTHAIFLMQPRDVTYYSGFIYTISKDYKIEFMNQTLIKHIGDNAIGSDCYKLIHGLTTQWTSDGGLSHSIETQ